MLHFEYITFVVSDVFFLYLFYIHNGMASIKPSENCENRLLVTLCMSVCPSAWNNHAPTGQIFMKLDTGLFFENLPRKFNFHLNLTRITGTLPEEQRTCLIVSRSFLLRMRNISDKFCRVNQNTHFMCSNFLSNIVPFMK
jgi:hypothetical protein